VHLPVNLSAIKCMAACQYVETNLLGLLFKVHNSVLTYDFMHADEMEVCKTLRSANKCTSDKCTFKRMIEQIITSKIHDAPVVTHWQQGDPIGRFFSDRATFFKNKWLTVLR
jgi:hypothetical protein